jgi:mannose/cellobiose epimerase-like protein (N-acyl-D-glucosamine 2-epimerase family)
MILTLVLKNNDMNNSDYSRRKFLKHNTFAGLGLMGSLTLVGTVLPTPSLASNSTDLKKIVGLDFKKLREQYKEALLGKFIPNMGKYVVDHELGGFMCSVDILTRKLVNTTKRAWFEGRGMWMYSFLYNNLDKDPTYLEIARKSKDFILKRFPTDGSYYISSFTKEGNPIGDTEGDIYGNLFVAEGLAEYAKAVNETKFFEQAKEIVLNAVQRYDRPEFTYNYKAESRIAGPRILGHWMILLSICTQMLRQKNDREIKALADRCVDAIMNHHLNKDYRLLNEALAHDLSPLADPLASQYGDLGHGCETLAFVMNYAVLIKDADLFHRSAKEFKRHVDASWDNVYGGYYHELIHVDKNIWTLNKLRWVHEEILIGAMILIEHAGDEWAIDCYIRTEQYIRKNYVRSEYAFVIDSGDRTMEKYSQVRAEHYHYPRQLMVGILAIDRIISRGEKPSGIFS